MGVTPEPGPDIGGRDATSARTRIGWGIPCLLLLCTSCSARAQVQGQEQGLLGPERMEPGGRVLWATSGSPVSPGVQRAARVLRSALVTQADSLALWRELESDRDVGSFALRQIAPLLLATGDTLGADQAWQRLAAARSPWTYEA